jgi:hypothetical protein
MGKREQRRRLGLRRERLRQLTELSTEAAGRVVGGTEIDMEWRDPICDGAGRVATKTCRVGE